MGRITEVAVEHESDKCRTFVIKDEGHTLGNALFHILNQYSDVTFAGYNVPHPAESVINIRIKSNTRKARDVLINCLQDLEKICDVTLETFDKSYEQYKSLEVPK